MNRERLTQILFSDATHLYVILDGALIPELRMKLYEMSPPHHCLYRGKLEPDIAEVAPYVAGLGADTDFSNWVLDECWGNNRAVFLHCPYSQIEVRRQLRSLLTVHDESGNPLLFRFYDPRVIRPFLPTCEGEELQSFFGKITNFLVENEDQQSIINFSLQNGELRSEILDLK